MELRSGIVLVGLTFPECPRSHEGALWFSDMHAHRIVRMTSDGMAETVVGNARQPAGLGWAPDGSLLHVRMKDRMVIRHKDDMETVVADLSGLEREQCNDMVVDAQGRAYIGGFGFNINAGEPPQLSHVYFVDTDGRASIAADGMRFPNGMVITPDHRTLIVAETTGRCLTAFDIAPDGSLSNRRQWAQLDTFPDGICLDAENAVWYAAPMTGECVRVREGGEVTDRVRVEAGNAYACMLGDPDRMTLYICTAATTPEELNQGKSTGFIESVRVEVPGVGLP